MASTQFKVKELAKEKEIAKEKELIKEKPEKDKPEKDSNPKEKQEKEKHEKEKHEKEQKDKNEKDVKEKPEKDSKDTKDQKDKPEKEKHEKEGKNEQKDKQEKEKHEKELKDRFPKEGAKEKENKLEQLEKLPEAPVEQPPTAPELPSGVSPKIFEKVPKLEKNEKLEWEKFGFEKAQFDGKDLVEAGIPVQPVGDPGLAQRVANLEAVVAQLTHFIPENLRPDLTQGALRQEPDVSPTAPKPEASADSGTAEEQKKSD